MNAPADQIRATEGLRQTRVPQFHRPGLSRETKCRPMSKANSPHFSDCAWIGSSYPVLQPRSGKPRAAFLFFREGRLFMEYTTAPDYFGLTAETMANGGHECDAASEQQQ
jgi:hypothetical protein